MEVSLVNIPFPTLHKSASKVSGSLKRRERLAFLSPAYHVLFLKNIFGYEKMGHEACELLGLC